ncbi:MAG: hypothetical protein RIT04_682 [Candidatus Parcubacteria bacterium]|jgi:hypothetical protein
MSTNKITTIGSLVQQGKLDEARGILAEALSGELSDIERGQAIVTLVTLYLQVKNQINKEFLADIKKAVETLKAVDAVDRTVSDGIRLEKVRASLS